MRKRPFLVAVLLLPALSLLDAQTTSTATQKFEVASVKRCADGKPVKGGGVDPGRLHLPCIFPVNLIRLAYLINPTGQPNPPISPTLFQRPVSGGPPWLESDRYTIDATAAQPVNIEMMKGPMLQALLEDRFGLKLHKETKQIPAYELTAGATKPKLQPAKPGVCVVRDRSSFLPPPEGGKPSPKTCGFLYERAKDGFEILGATMADLCRELSKYTDREIIDKTGIAGTYDVRLDLKMADIYDEANPSGPFESDGGVAISAAVKKLGLKMSNTKQAGEFLVIDQVQRPSEN